MDSFSDKESSESDESQAGDRIGDSNQVKFPMENVIETIITLNIRRKKSKRIMIQQDDADSYKMSLLEFSS